MNFPDFTPVFWFAFVAFFVIVFGAIGWGISFVAPWWVTPAAAVVGGIAGHIVFETIT